MLRNIYQWTRVLVRNTASYMNTVYNTKYRIYWRNTIHSRYDKKFNYQCACVIVCVCLRLHLCVCIRDIMCDCVCLYNIITFAIMVLNKRTLVGCIMNKVYLFCYCTFIIYTTNDMLCITCSRLSYYHWTPPICLHHLNTYVSFLVYVLIH